MTDIEDMDKDLARQILEELKGMDPERIVPRELMEAGLYQVTMDRNHAKLVTQNAYEKNNGNIPYADYVSYLKFLVAE